MPSMKRLRGSAGPGEKAPQVLAHLRQLGSITRPEDLLEFAYALLHRMSRNTQFPGNLRIEFPVGQHASDLAQVRGQM